MGRNETVTGNVFGSMSLWFTILRFRCRFSRRYIYGKIQVSDCFHKFLLDRQAPRQPAERAVITVLLSVEHKKDAEYNYQK